MEIILPTKDMVLTIHDMVLSVSGGLEGTHNENNLDGAIARPLSFVQYDDNYDIDTICAILLDSFARNHCFNEGNKRTAVLTVIVTYRINGIIFTANTALNAEFEDLVLWVVLSKPAINVIAQRLKTIRSTLESNGEAYKMINSFLEILHLKTKGR